MRLFKKAAAIIAEVQRMASADSNRREDRATVSNFFNGAPPLTDEEAKELGFTVNVNHLFGYNDIDDAAGQMFGLYTKPTHLFSVELDAAPPGKGMEWGAKAQAAATRVLRKITSFKSAFEGATGDASLHGEAVFHFTSKTFPLPKQAPLSLMLVPDKASTNTEDLTHFCREGSLTLRELHRIIKKHPPGWKLSAVRRVLKKFYDRELSSTPSGFEIDKSNVEELEYQRQENSSKDSSNSLSVPVYYFYQQNCDARGEPYSLNIMLRDSCYQDSDATADDRVLYEHEECYPRVQSIIQPMFMDCVIGGESKWHRVLGLGTLNYALNQSLELLICRAKQATVEASMNLWQVKDTTTRDAVQQILLKHNGVLPVGMELIPNRYEPNLANIYQMIQMFRMQGKENSGGQQANVGDKNDQLEVQALAQQHTTATRSNNRSANSYDYLDRMWHECFARLTNPFIDERECGYSEVMDFQGEMERHGIPLYYLQPHNVQIRAVRIVGDGLRSKEVAAANYLSANRQQFAPQVQPKITRLLTGLALDNYTIAEELTPIQEEPDTPQLMRAETENSIMMTTRRKQEPKADDIDELHVPEHFPAMEILLQDALQFQNAAFTPPQAQSFQLIGAHIMMHVNRIEGRAQNTKNDPHRMTARSMKEQLNALAAMGDKLVQNMQQGMEKQREQMDPIELARLQLDLQKHQLATEKLQHSMQKFERQQGAREQQQAFNQVLQLDKNRREDLDARQGRALSDVETALKVKTAADTSNGEQ
jgi:hypothetical protein